jgi:hypothetical protein
MKQIEIKRRPRGTSPRGDFEPAKMSATVSKEARVVASKEKTKALRVRADKCSFVIRQENGPQVERTQDTAPNNY